VVAVKHLVQQPLVTLPVVALVDLVEQMLQQQELLIAVMAVVAVELLLRLAQMEALEL
jgi:hypothetical protein